MAKSFQDDVSQNKEVNSGFFGFWYYLSPFAKKIM